MSRFRWHAPVPEEVQPGWAMPFRLSAIYVNDNDIHIAFRSRTWLKFRKDYRQYAALRFIEAGGLRITSLF